MFSLVSTATGFLVTSTISASVCVCAWFVINWLLPLERNEALPSCLPASSRTCQVSRSYCMRSQPRCGTPPTSSRMQRVLTLLDVLVHDHVLSRHTQRVYRPARREGERRAVRQTCGSLSLSLDLGLVCAKSPIHCHRSAGKYSQVEAVHEPHQHF